jgi:hypothetical protein
MPVPPSPPDHNQHGECSDSRANPAERLIPGIDARPQQAT